jgi:hypothetical protein
VEDSSAFPTTSSLHTHQQKTQEQDSPINRKDEIARSDVKHVFERHNSSLRFDPFLNPWPNEVCGEDCSDQRRHSGCQGSRIQLNGRWNEGIMKSAYNAMYGERTCNDVTIKRG